MKEKNKKIDTLLQTQSEGSLPHQKTSKEEDNDFPGYPIYPESEDIYDKAKEEDLNTEDLTKIKSQKHKVGERNEKDFPEDVTGEDLDVPGSEADEAKANSGSEDEENNYYSLGGDDHNDLDEDKAE